MPLITEVCDMGFDVVVFADADIVDGGYPGAPEWITRVVELEIMLDGESVAWAEWEDNPDAATPNEAIRDAESIAMEINRELNTGFDLAAHDFESIGQWIHSAIGDCIYWSTGFRDFEFGLYDAAFIGLASRNAASALDWRKKMSGKKVAQHGWVQTRERNIELDYFDEDELLDMYGAYTNEVWRKEDASGMVGVVSHHIGMADDWWTWDTYIFGAGADCGICDSVDEGIKMCEMSFANPGFTVGASARSAGNELRDDFIAAYMYSYGATRAEAESVFDDADDAFIEAVIEGWKGDAFRNFYDASLGMSRSLARRKTASTFELARKMFVSLVKMDYPYIEYAIQNDGYTFEMVDAWDDEGAIAAFLEKYPDAYVYDEPKDISNKWASRKVAQVYPQPGPEWEAGVVDYVSGQTGFKRSYANEGWPGCRGVESFVYDEGDGCYSVLVLKDGEEAYENWYCGESIDSILDDADYEAEVACKGIPLGFDQYGTPFWSSAEEYMLDMGYPKMSFRKTAQEEEPVSEDPEEAFADLVDKLRETSFENLGDELEDIIDDPKLYALLSEGFGSGELASVTMSTSAEAIPVQRLIPLQREIGLDNSLSYPLSGDPSYCFNPPVTVVAPIVTYNGMFIVDGHHRWSQVYMMNPDASINAINFSYGDQNPLRILRNFQGAIAVAEGEVPSQVVGVADVYSMGEDQIRSYIEDNIGQTCVDIVCNEVGLDSEDEVVEYILGNVMDLKQYAIPYGDAPARKDMPQTTEDAIDIAEDGQTNI